MNQGPTRIITPSRTNRSCAPQQRGGLILWLLLLLPILPVVIFFLFPNFVKKNVPFFEGEPPVLDISGAPKVIGLDVAQFSIMVSDEGAGVDEAIARIEQGGKPIDLALLKRPDSTQPLSVKLNAKELGLREGVATFQFTAFDRSFWSNRVELSSEVRISYSRPRLEVLTSQHNVAQGGTNLLFYRLTAGEIIASGIRVGNIEQLGSPAVNFDPAFSGEPKLYAVLFAVPKSFDPSKDKLEAFARDIAGNTATAPVNHRILRKNFRDAPVTIDENFLRPKITDLWPGYQRVDTTAVALDPSTATAEELSNGFQRINREYRSLLEKQIRQTLQTSSEKRSWIGTILRPMLGTPTSQFGEQRRYLLNGAEISQSNHDGIDLASVANAVVRSSAGGTIRFADDLGIYGQTVIVDHGLGLSSLYGHLSAISVNVGDPVTADQQIGRSGATGLAGGDHLHFELRVHGEPVTPIEWWDGRWVNDHILDKIETMKRLLVVESQQRVPALE